MRDHEFESASGQMPSVDVRRATYGDAVVLTVVGEVDLSNEAQLEAIFTHVQQQKPPILIIDLSEVTFLGSSGLRLLVAACDHAGESVVRIAAASISARRAIDATALDQVLPLFPTVDDALETNLA